MTYANKNAFDGFIFDMDGVLVDTMHYHYLANQQLSRDLGFELSEQENNQFRGLKRRDVICTLCDMAGITPNEELIVELANRKNQYFQRYLNEINTKDILPGIPALLSELKNNQIKLAVASSSANAPAILEKTGLLPYFDVIVDIQTIQHGKPNPEIFLTAAKLLELKPERCVAMEDGEAGLQAILKTSMFSIGVGEEDYIKQADWYVPSAELVNLNLLNQKISVCAPKSFVLAVDGGGTYTRAIIADNKGRLLSSVETTGGSHPGKNSNAKENVRKSIIQACSESQVPLNNVKVTVCGFAGLDAPSDIAWANEFLSIPELSGEKIVVNDSVIARKAAFNDGVGIIAIAGTGSIVTGFFQNGDALRNYDFGHLAYAGARYLSIDALHAILAGEYDESDEVLINEILSFWKVSDIEELRNYMLEKLAAMDLDFSRELSKMCPIITLSAKNGSHLSQKVCTKAMKNLSVGVKLVASKFDKNPIPLSVFGGVIEDSYNSSLFSSFLKNSEFEFVMKNTNISPVHGALTLAIEKLGELNK